MTSRLYQALVEKSLAISVSAISWQLRDPSLFSLFAALTPGTAHEDVERIVREEIARFARDGVTDEELAKARTQIEADVIFERDTTDQVAGSLTEAVAIADWEWFVEYPERVAAVTSTDVLAAARRYFLDDALTVGWFVPKIVEKAA